MLKKIYWRYYKTRASFRRKRRLWFPSPAELRLIVLMGGRVWQWHRLRDPKTGFPFAIVISRGKIFRSEKMQREVRVGPYYVDFGNDIRRGLEVDGRDWLVKHIPAHWLWLDPNKVQREVLAFLTH